MRAIQAGWVPPKQSRWNITRGALDLLEQAFNLVKFPSLFVRQQLAQELNVSCRQVQVWFQNRRQRERNYNRERGIHDDDLDDSTETVVHPSNGTEIEKGEEQVDFLEECKR